jgi:transcriptional regulator with XRE-family HTH domain
MATPVSDASVRRFGVMIAEMRDDYRLTRAELAKRAGLSHSTIACVERGSKQPCDGTIRKLEQAFGCRLYLEEHKEVPVKVLDREADIDEAIAPLIEQIWLAGINTVMSCQQSIGGKIWVEFDTCEDLVEFLNIVMGWPTEDREDRLFGRINPELEADGPYPEWSYELNLADLAIDDGRYAGPDLACFVSVRFPPQDYPTILERMKNYNAD